MSCLHRTVDEIIVVFKAGIPALKALCEKVLAQGPTTPAVPAADVAQSSNCKQDPADPPPKRTSNRRPPRANYAEDSPVEASQASERNEDSDFEEASPCLRTRGAQKRKAGQQQGSATPTPRKKVKQTPPDAQQKTDGRAQQKAWRTSLSPL